MRCMTTILALLALAAMIRADEPEVTITPSRSPSNPLITAATPGAGSNVSGPSVIRAPDWVEKPLGKYYMYFARHMSSSMEGAYIRLAYSDSPEGPWTVYTPGSLKRSELKDKDSKSWGRRKQHIASPDVHVDREGQRVVLYFHGSYFGHNTGCAVSTDGIRFEDQNVDLGRPYLRMFEHGGHWYGVSQGGKIGDAKSALIRRFVGPFGPTWEDGPSILPRVRHVAVLKQAGRLVVFYSRIGHEPERILASVVDLSGDWQKWRASAPIEVLKPEHPYEGSDLPLAPSRGGTGRNKHELRDPCVFVDRDGKIYLYYTIKGETGVAVAKLTIAETD